jgi:hypothetical protein
MSLKKIGSKEPIVKIVKESDIKIKETKNVK